MNSIENIQYCKWQKSVYCGLGLWILSLEFKKDHHLIIFECEVVY